MTQANTYIYTSGTETHSVRSARHTSSVEEDVYSEDEEPHGTYQGCDEDLVLGVQEEQRECHKISRRRPKDANHGCEEKGGEDDDYVSSVDKQHDGCRIQRREPKDVKNYCGGKHVVNVDEDCVGIQRGSRSTRAPREHDHTTYAQRDSEVMHVRVGAPAESLYDGISRLKTKEVEYDNIREACVSRAHKEANKVPVSSSKIALSSSCDGARKSRKTRSPRADEDPHRSVSSSKVQLPSWCDVKHEDGNQDSRVLRANEEARGASMASKMQLPSSPSCGVKHDNRDARLRRAKEEAIRSAMSSIDAWGVTR
jgi:hypothetical protein